MSVLIILSFFGFLRYRKTLHFRRSDVVFKKLDIEIFIEKRKRNWFYIAKGQSELCQLENPNRFWKITKINKKSK